jgi:mannose-6-phosphate isomerase-like protein (cupin superfamily)
MTTPETIQLGAGAQVSVIAAATQTAGHCGVVRGHADPGVTGPPPHLHDSFAEIYIVLEGRLELRRGDELLDLGPGDVAVVPPGVVHAFRSCGPQTAQWINIYTPGGFEGYFAEAAAALPPDAPPDPAVLAAIAARYGLSLAP